MARAWQGRCSVISSLELRRTNGPCVVGSVIRARYVHVHLVSFLRKVKRGTAVTHKDSIRKQYKLLIYKSVDVINNTGNYESL